MLEPKLIVTQQLMLLPSASLAQNPMLYAVFLVTILSTIFYQCRIKGFAKDAIKKKSGLMNLTFGIALLLMIVQTKNLSMIGTKWHITTGLGDVAAIANCQPVTKADLKTKVQVTIKAK